MHNHKQFQHFLRKKNMPNRQMMRDLHQETSKMAVEKISNICRTSSYFLPLMPLVLFAFVGVVDAIDNQIYITD